MQVFERIHDKKGQVPNVFMMLIGLGLGLVVFTIVMSIGGDVLGSLKAQQTAGTAAFNITEDGETGVLNISTFSPTFGTIIVLAGILLLLGAVIGSIALFRS